MPRACFRRSDSTRTAPDAGVQSDTFARAYLGAFAVYWFMTSGSGPWQQPDRHADRHAGTDVDQLGRLAVVSAAGGREVGAAVCAALLAIFAIFSILTGDFVAGAPRWSRAGGARHRLATVANELSGCARRSWIRRTCCAIRWS